MIRELILRLPGLSLWRRPGQRHSLLPLAQLSARELADLPLPRGVDLD